MEEISQKTIDGITFLNLVKGGAINLNLNRNDINELNVFPVPDGDTGDNMYMTIQSGVNATVEDNSIGKVASNIARGMLLGARGNSGVILSRIFYGIAEGFNGVDSADYNTVINALKNGVKEAYASVSSPVEGTILTVYREMVERVELSLYAGCSLKKALCEIECAAKISLDNTPELLDILKNAGVVDSGGAGLLAIITGMKDIADGKKLVDKNGDTQGASKIDLDLFTENSVLEYGYCTEFLLRLQWVKTDINAFDCNLFRSKLEKLGNSVVAFKDGSIVKVHVHTFKPYEILAFAQEYGEFLTIKIENMSLQHNGEKGNDTKQNTPLVRRKRHKKFATVAVAMGEGIKENFLSIGADAVVYGGQCANPSVADFIEAYNSIDADTILVFPGDSNIILTATQAGELYEKAKVVVVPCKSTGEIYAALSSLDTSSGKIDKILEDINSVLSEVVCGSVSKASRNADIDGVEVKENDYIGYSGKTVYSDSPDKITALLSLAEKLDAGEFGVLLVICGIDSTEEEKQRLQEVLTKTYRYTEIIFMDGGQPVQDYILLLQ